MRRCIRCSARLGITERSIEDRDPVVRLELDRDGLAFLADSLPQGDGFTRELQEVLERVDAAAEATS
jgi:hypothetical protein